MITQNQRFIGVVIVVGLLLMIPLVAMQFTNEVSWSLFDFIVAGGLLLGTGLLVEYVLRKVKRSRQRIIICGVILVAFALIWIELAVGIFGTPFAGN